MKAAGADLVLEPFSDAADRGADLLVSGIAPERLEEGGEEEQRDIVV